MFHVMCRISSTAEVVCQLGGLYVQPLCFSPFRILCLVNHSGSLLLAVVSSEAQNVQARCCYCYTFGHFCFVSVKSDFWQCAVGGREGTMCLVFPALISLSILSKNIS